MRSAVTAALAGGVVAAGATFVPLGAGAVAPDLAVAAAPVATSPNIVTVMLDDQDLASMKYLSRVRRLARHGVTFDRHTASYSLCCPSRATYLSGQYAHNHGVRGNFAPYGGYGNLNTDETLPVWMEKAGYVTTHLGKYLNGYNPLAELARSGQPRGWTEWHGTLDPTTYLYHGYLVNENGRMRSYGMGEASYQADVMTAEAVDFIERRAGGDAPFFLDLSYLGPHFEVRPGTDLDLAGNLEGSTEDETLLGVAPVPAKRHRNLFPDLRAPRPPSFNEADVSDKPAALRDRPRFDADRIAQIDRWYRARVRSVQAIDEGIARIVATLRAEGVWDQTYLIITSDNGYQLGEHRLALAKVDHYDASTRLPLIVLGPGVSAGGHVRDWTSNVDLHATILGLARAPRPGASFPLDGISLARYLRDPDLRLGRVIEHEAYNTLGQSATPDWQGVRVGRWKWIEYANGERELYDLVEDPYELDSRHADPALVRLRSRLHGVLETMRDCSGRECVVTGYDDDWGLNLIGRR